jgi:predicted transcriptional regulator
MSRRTNRLTAELSAFVQQYRRKAQRGVEPNDRGYSREAEELMKRLSPEELSALLNSESEELLPSVRQRKPGGTDHLPKKTGRGP